MIIERFKHFRQSVIESISRRSLNIFDDDDDDIHDDNIHDDDIYESDIHDDDIHDNNIHNDDIHDDDIHDNDDENAECVKSSIEIFEKFQ